MRGRGHNYLDPLGKVSHDPSLQCLNGCNLNCRGMLPYKLVGIARNIIYYTEKVVSNVSPPAESPAHKLPSASPQAPAPHTTQQDPTSTSYGTCLFRVLTRPTLLRTQLLEAI